MKKSFARLHIFDLDRTLLKGNGSFSFGVFLFKRGLISWFKTVRILWAYSRHNWHRITTAEVHQKIFSELFLGKPKEPFVSLIQDFLNSRKEDLFYPPALIRLQQARLNGDHIAICSSSPDFIVECFARHLNIAEWCGSKYHVDKHGNFVVISDPIQGSEKVNYVHSLQTLYSLNKEQIIAYSDSIRDLEFLRAAGYPVAVQPDRALKKICLKEQWEIL